MGAEMAEWVQDDHLSFPSVEGASRGGFEGACVPSAAQKLSVPKALHRTA